MPTTLKELASRANVHPSTVSRVVNQDPSLRIAPATRARIEALLRAVNIVGPALERFYDSLSDEQKARFNAIGAPLPSQRPQGERRRTGRDGASAQPNPQAACEAEATPPWPTAQIERTVRPTPAQREKLDELEMAAATVADAIKASCLSQVPATPPGRLDAVAKWLDAMRQAAKSMRAAVNDFYTSLDDGTCSNVAIVRNQGRRIDQRR